MIYKVIPFSGVVTSNSIDSNRLGRYWLWTSVKQFVKQVRGVDPHQFEEGERIFSVATQRETYIAEFRSD